MMARKVNTTGRTQSGNKFAKQHLATMQSPAWRALSPYSQRLFPWLLLEWNGPQHNNNGRIQLSAKQASENLGCNRETARRAFLDLQAKGFLAVTQCATLGAAGTGKAQGHFYEITELGTPANPTPCKLFRDWKPGGDFPVKRAKANNPRGLGGAANFETELTDGPRRTYSVSTGATPKTPSKHHEAGIQGYSNENIGLASPPYLPPMYGHDTRNALHRHSNENNGLASLPYLPRKSSLDLREQAGRNRCLGTQEVGRKKQVLRTKEVRELDGPKLETGGAALNPPPDLSVMAGLDMCPLLAANRG